MAILLKNVLEKSFFPCDFDNFDGSIGCTTKFHVDGISIFLSISIRSKVIALFVNHMPKFNIQSMIAID